MRKYTTKPITDSEIQKYIKTRIQINPMTNCWEWTQRLTKGYGAIDYETRAYKHCQTQLAHRVSYMVYVNPIEENMVIRHMCNNKKCCNPDHLQPGTIRENVLDMFKTLPEMDLCGLQFLLLCLQNRVTEVEAEIFKRKNPGS
jgi:hypothetical protein